MEKTIVLNRGIGNFILKGLFWMLCVATDVNKAKPGRRVWRLFLSSR